MLFKPKFDTYLVYQYYSYRSIYTFVFDLCTALNLILKRALLNFWNFFHKLTKTVVSFDNKSLTFETVVKRDIDLFYCLRVNESNRFIFLCIDFNSQLTLSEIHHWKLEYFFALLPRGVHSIAAISCQAIIYNLVTSCVYFIYFILYHSAVILYFFCVVTKRPLCSVWIERLCEVVYLSSTTCFCSMSNKHAILPLFVSH